MAAAGGDCRPAGGEDVNFFFLRKSLEAPPSPVTLGSRLLIRHIATGHQMSSRSLCKPSMLFQRCHEQEPWGSI